MDARKIFVGRKAELEQFKEALKYPKGQAVLVVGQAGMGKTWLVNKMAKIAENHPDLKCGWVRYEVTPTDSVDSTMALIMDNAFEAANTEPGSFDKVPGRRKQWMALLKTVIPKGREIAELVNSLKRDPTKNTREQFLERLRLISKSMPKDGRVIFIIDPEKYMQKDSDQSWAIVIRDLPEKIKFVFPQRPEDELVKGSAFKRLKNVLFIPDERLGVLGESEVEELVRLRADDVGQTENVLRKTVKKYQGHPYAIVGALDLLKTGTNLEELPQDPTGIADVQWRRICQSGRGAIELFKAYAVLEIGVPDEVVEAVSGLDSDERQHLLTDTYLKSLLREGEYGLRIFHGVLADYVRSQISMEEKVQYHQRAVEVYRKRSIGDKTRESSDISKEISFWKESILVGITNDQATARDGLGFHRYVKAIADFLTSKDTEPPLTLSVEGEWGRGKTSFMLQLEEEVQHRDGLTVRFNAWRYEKEESLCAAFALRFSREVAKQLSGIRRFIACFMLARDRFRWKAGFLDMIRFGAITGVWLSLTIMFVWLWRTHGVLLRNAVGTNGVSGVLGFVLKHSLKVGSISAVVTLLLFWSGLKKVVTNPFNIKLKRHMQVPDYQSKAGFIENFHEDFGKVVNAYAGHSKVYVFIDDIDRCEVAKAADLIQAINLMISTSNPRLVFIIGMDREKVAASLAVKYEKLLPYLSSPKWGIEDDSGIAIQSLQGLEYGYSFIEKFVQLPFHVPRPDEDDLVGLLKSICKQDREVKARKPYDGIDSYPKLAVDEKVEGEPLHESAEDVYKEVSKRNGFEDKEIDLVMPDFTKKEYHRDTQLLLSGDSETVREIALMVASALDNNPRRLKQFINLFRLRAFIAAEFEVLGVDEKNLSRGNVTLWQLGKFVAISLNWPILLAGLSNSPRSLGELQKIALKELDAASVPTLGHWSRDNKLMELLRKRCAIGERDEWKYRLDGIEIERLLAISPAVRRPDRILKESSAESGMGPMLDALSASRLPEHVLASEGAEGFVRVFLDESVRPLLNHGLLDSALSLSYRALELVTTGSKEEASVCGILAIIHRIRGNLDLAEEQALKALKIEQKLGESQQLGSLYKTLGEVYQTRRELDKAEEMHNKALEIDEKAGHLEGVARNYGNLGLIYFEKGEIDKAEEMHKKALEIDEKLGMQVGIANQYANLGLIYENRGDIDKAEEMYLKALEIDNKVGRLEGQAIQYGNLGVVYKQRGNIRKAREYWERALELYKKIGMPHMVEKAEGWIERLREK